MPSNALAGDPIAWFDTLANADVPRVGGKNASLGELVRQLAPHGVRVPAGFATTADAYRAYLEANRIAAPLRALLAALQRGEADLHTTGEAARRLFLEGEFPPAIAQAIRAAYRALSRRSGVAEASVAVRSSATAEDLADASFAGQQESFLNVHGEPALSTHAAAAMPRCSPTGQSATASPRASIT
jgi:pyruvate,water dikinase